MSEGAQRIPTGLTSSQVEELVTEKELLYGIYRAVSTVRVLLVAVALLAAAAAAVGVAMLFG